METVDQFDVHSDNNDIHIYFVEAELDFESVYYDDNDCLLDEDSDLDRDFEVLPQLPPLRQRRVGAARARRSWCPLTQ